MKKSSLSSSFLSKEQVEHIAHLANLSLTEKEIKKFQKQLSQILNYFGVLQKVDTAKVKPTSQVTGLENVLGFDAARPSMSAKQALSGSAKKHNQFFQVKGIFEDES